MRKFFAESAALPAGISADEFIRSLGRAYLPGVVVFRLDSDKPLPIRSAQIGDMILDGVCFSRGHTGE